MSIRGGIVASKESLDRLGRLDNTEYAGLRDRVARSDGHCPRCVADIKKLEEKQKKIDRIREKYQNINLDLGSGGIGQKQKGFIGLDIQELPGVDIVWDVMDFPWPLADNSVNILLASHVMEHTNPAKFFNILNEMWRVIKPDGQLWFAVPYAGSTGAYQDPTHVRPGFNEATLAYLDPNHGSKLFDVYKPLPWRIIKAEWDQMSVLEATLEPMKEHNIEIPKEGWSILVGRKVRKRSRKMMEVKNEKSVVKKKCGGKKVVKK